MTLPLYLSYWIKMLLISAVLRGYYRLFLRETAAQSFNRYYLIASVFLALGLPFVRIPKLNWTDPVDQAASTLNRPRPSLFADPHTSPFQAYTEFRKRRDLLATYIYIAYGLVTLALFWPLLRSLYGIRRLKRQYAANKVADVFVYVTPEAGTPFSFFNHLFWNENLPTETQKGQLIFRHELYHIRQLHTLDILVLETVRRLFWCNPFLYLSLRELKLVHETLADRYALGTALPTDPRPATDDKSSAADDKPSAAAGSRSEYAEWLVWQSQGQTDVPRLVHSFYHTQLKSRIDRILYPAARAGYATRWLSLPLAVVLLVAFAAKDSSRFKRTNIPGPKNEALTRFFLHNIRYPQAALEQGKEGGGWFSVMMDASGHKRGGGAGTQELGSGATVITVTSRPYDPQQPVSQAKDTAEEPFLLEALRVSTMLIADSAVPCPPGDYTFSVVFKIEK